MLKKFDVYSENILVQLKGTNSNRDIRIGWLPFEKSIFNRLFGRILFNVLIF